MKRSSVQRVGVMLALLVALLAPLMTVPAATAQTFTCDDFSSQEAAQFILDAEPSLADELDEDGDGVACNELENAQDEPAEEATTEAEPTEEATEETTEEATVEDAPVDTVDEEELLYASLGADRTGFEDEYGEPGDDSGEDDFAEGVAYEEADGYETILVFWHEDQAAHIQLTAAGGWSEEKALDIAERFLPGDTELDEDSEELEGGELLFAGTSEALEDVFNADVYEEYEVGDDPGDLRVILIPGEEDIKTVDIAIGTGEEYTGEAADDPTDEPTEEPADDPDADADEYLTTVRGEVDELSASIDRFFEILGGEGDLTDAEIEELSEILALWSDAEVTAQDLEAPDGYEEIHETYTDLTGALSTASIDFLVYLSTDIDSPEEAEALASFQENIATAEELAADLDDLLTDEGV